MDCQNCNAACCRNVGNRMPNKNGICDYLDQTTNKCTIYSTRPLMCNVEEFHKHFIKESMTLEEWKEENLKACIILKGLK